MAIDAFCFSRFGSMFFGSRNSSKFDFNIAHGLWLSMLQVHVSSFGETATRISDKVERFVSGNATHLTTGGLDGYGLIGTLLPCS